MKHILSAIVLLYAVPSQGLFFCFRKAQHEKLKNTEFSKPSTNPLATPTSDSFLNRGNNRSKTISLSLSKGEQIFVREVPYKEFHQNGQWTLHIENDANQCIEISEPEIKSARSMQESFIYSWRYIPKTKGAAIVRAIYTSNSQEPYAQQFSVHVES